MYSMLEGMRVVEGASFVAAPSCALHLAQLGADVIRFDPIGGGPDFHRWPRSEHPGASLYWEGLQKGKRSIAIDLGSREGRELAVALITAPGEGGGLFVTNFPRGGFLAHDKLAQKRPDLITVRVQGWADGSTGLDYTINAVAGYPHVTGPEDTAGPVNHVMPGWDISTGALAAFHLMAAERFRRATGRGQEVALPLSSVAFCALGALGQIAEVETTGADRPRIGNSVFGAFGRDFACADGRRVMIVAITQKQWSGLLASLGIADEIAAIERERGVSFAVDEGTRFEHRDAIDPVVERAVGARPYAAIKEVFDAQGVCWGPYKDLSESLRTEPELSEANPMMERVAHPSGYTYLTPGSPAIYSDTARIPVARAPRLGEHTEAVLAEVLGLATHEIGALLERGVVARAGEAEKRR
ncbi:MAG: CoA transferase [Burkholderiaceae bacterium]|nr:CoA transferase [Burkholderiaceae bacterium]